MDTVTHVLVGTALAKTRFGSAARVAPLALVAAANFPDFENLVLAFCDKPTNMLHHRSVTHSVLGLALQIPLFTLLMWWLERRLRTSPKRPLAPAPEIAGPPDNAAAPPAAAPSFAWLLAGVALAMVSHVLLDLLNTYGVRPWLPFDWTWYHGDIAFIIDPYIWLFLLGATALAGLRTRWGALGLTLLALGMSAAVLIAPPTPGWLLLAWPLAIGAVALARVRGWGRRKPNVIVVVGFVLMLGHLGLLYWAGRTAGRMSAPVLAERLAPAEYVTGRTLSPQPANPFRWEVIWQTPQAVYRHEFSILDQPGGVIRLPNRLDTPLVQKLADTRAGQAWRGFARHPVAAIARNGHGLRVYLLDARYGVLPPRGFATFAIDVP